MFTGLIETTGLVVSKKKTRPGLFLEVKPRKKLKRLKKGESISVSGVCLTLVHEKGGVLGFDLVPETLRRSRLGELKKGDTVNLERALRYGDRMGGHVVQGHVETVGKVQKFRRGRDGNILSVSFPAKLKRFIFPKGSIALDGISLTIGKVRKNILEVHLVPHTLKITDLGRKKAGDSVNLETDRG